MKRNSEAENKNLEGLQKRILLWVTAKKSRQKKKKKVKRKVSLLLAVNFLFHSFICTFNLKHGPFTRNLAIKPQNQNQKRN